MIRRRSISNKRIVAPVRRTRTATRPGRPQRTAPTPVGVAGEGEKLSVRLAKPHDEPWLAAWLAAEGLPRPLTRRARSLVLLQDSQRVGHMAVKEGVIETARGREEVMWIISLFLVPAVRGQGIMMRFGQLLSRDFFPTGRVAAHVAVTNTRVVKMLDEGGWRRLRTTGKYIQFMLELERPFRRGR